VTFFQWDCEETWEEPAKQYLTDAEFQYMIILCFVVAAFTDESRNLLAPVGAGFAQP
jgi:hypothetical protein